MLLVNAVKNGKTPSHVKAIHNIPLKKVSSFLIAMLTGIRIVPERFYPVPENPVAFFRNGSEEFQRSSADL